MVTAPGGSASARKEQVVLRKGTSGTNLQAEHVPDGSQRQYHTHLGDTCVRDRTAHHNTTFACDNTTFTALLPHVMVSEGVCGATVFLDVSKAFDTVDRDFLFRIMEAVGPSPGMAAHAWALCLLSVHLRATCFSATHPRSLMMPTGTARDRDAHQPPLRRPAPHGPFLTQPHASLQHRYLLCCGVLHCA